MSHEGNNIPFQTSAYGNPNSNWMGGNNNLSRSSSCSSLDIAATLVSSIQAAELATANANMNMNVMGNSNIYGNNVNFQNNNSSAIGGLAGLGLQAPAAMGLQAPAAVMGLNQQTNGNGIIDDLQRILNSNILNLNVAMPAFGQVNNMNNSLESLTNQFHQMQQQMEISRQREVETLMRLQQQLQLRQQLQLQQQLQQHQGISFQPDNFSQSFTVPTLPQQTDNFSQSFTVPTLPQQSINPVSVRDGDTRSSNGSLCSDALLKIWKDDQDAKNNSLTSQRFGEHNPANALENQVEREVKRSISTDEIVFVPTKDLSPPSSLTRSNDSENSQTASGDFSRCRSNSNSSFDALLSAVGDDLVEFDKEKRGESNKINYEKQFSSLSSDSLSKAPDMHHLTNLFGDGPSNNESSYTPPMTHNFQAVREMAAHQLMAQANPLMLAQLVGASNQGAQLAQESNVNKQVQRISSSDTSSCAIELAMKRLSSVLNENPYIAEGTVEKPPAPDDPRKDLEMFLEEYGEEGKKARVRVLCAIDDSESSLAKIHEWDRGMGHRKCSNRTVVKTRRSRAKLKAFLQGMKPPKEPKSRRKKAE
jgi:hypothetical protein